MSNNLLQYIKLFKIKNMNTAPTPAPTPTPDRLNIDHEAFEWAEQRTYAPDDRGDIFATYTLSEPGTELAWREHSPTRRLNRQIMLTTEAGNRFYVYGDRIFDVDASIAQDKPVTVELPVDGALPNATVGEAWTTPLGTSKPIAKVEILGGKLDAMEAHEVQTDFPYTNEPNEIAQAAAMFAPFQKSAYKISKSDLLKEGVFRKANATKDQVKRAGKKAISAAREAAVVGVAYSWVALERSGQAAKAVGKYATETYYNAETKAALKLAEKYLRVGAFATAMGSDLSEVKKTFDAMKDEDEKYERYDPENARDVSKRAAHRALLRLAAARMTKDVVKDSFKNRKT